MKFSSHSKHLTPATIILVSESPRRRQLLSALGIPFKTLSPSIEEDKVLSQKLELGVEANALKKAISIGPKLKTHEIAVGADTVVSIKGKVLGKPRDPKEAKYFLSLLSNQKHEVFTGLAFYSKKWGTRLSHSKSTVTFRKLTGAEVQMYLALKEPYDKAGAYAVQGAGSIFIKNIEGSYTNVMGFPIELFLKELPLYSKTAISDWFEARSTK